MQQTCSRREKEQIHLIGQHGKPFSFLQLLPLFYVWLTFQLTGGIDWKTIKS
jgi:hypothetical protein